MNPCPQCGAVPQASDKFCNICGTPVGAAGFGPPPQGGGFPPPQGGGFGAPPPNAYGAPPQGGGPGGAPPLRCQMGHDIPPGASYCIQGHPIALDAMPFANDQYGGGYGQQPPPGQFGGPPPGFGPPPGQQQGFGTGGTDAPPPGYGAPYQDPNSPYGYPQPGQFGAPPPPGFGPPPGQFGGPPPPGFGPPPGQFGPPPGQFGPPQGGFGAPPEPPMSPQPNLPPTALRGFLVSYQSNTQGDFWPLQGGRKTVGRANSGEQVDIPLSDATISSRHAAFVVDAVTGAVAIEDTGSTNGTFVNEDHIGFNGKRDLRDGDKIRFGGYTALVKIVHRI